MSSTLLIYAAHFGLRDRPFALLPDPDYLYWSKDHLLTYSMLEYGLLTHAPITLITGEIGAGKTTLIRQLLRNIPGDFTVGLISNAHGNRGELLHWVLLSLEQTVESGSSYVQLFTQFQKFLIREYAAGRRTLLIFDEAQNLSVETLEELRMFSNINTDKDEVLQIVLAGQPELWEKIRQPGLLQFAQRVGADFHLPSMNGEAVRKYIHHRLQVAGATREIFTREACDAVHTASGGVPRVINKICDYALAYAYSDGLTVVEANVVTKVLSDWRKLDRGAIVTNFVGPSAAAANVANTIDQDNDRSSREKRRMEVPGARALLASRTALENAEKPQQDPLDSMYLTVYFERLWVKIEDHGVVRNKGVYVALGLDASGERQLLGIWICQCFGVKSWLAVLDELADRGIKDILVAMTDGAMGFTGALATAFPKTTMQVGTTHLVRSLIALVSQKDRKSIRADLKTLHLADYRISVEELIEKFEAKWGEAYPAIVSSLRQSIPTINSFLTLPQPVRKAFYTDAGLETLLRSLSRIIREHEPFPSDQVALQKLHAAAEYAEFRWRKIDNWDRLTEHFSSLFGSRFVQIVQ
jgi:type II secretory pathway predicted ATPase ExeA